MNGDFLTDEQARISVFDRGLMLGDGLFETCLAVGAQVQFWDAHLDRLFAAAAFCNIALGVERATISNAAARILAAHDTQARHALRLTLTRGNGGRGLIADDAPANLIISASQAAPAPAQYRLMLSDICRAEGAPSSRYKMLGFGDNIAARRAALAAGCDEALLPNHSGRIACAAAGNLFIWDGDTLRTPPESEGALGGIMRAQILAQAEAHGLRAQATPITRDMLMAAALFLSNSLIGCVPAYIDTPTKAPPHVLAALAQITARGFAPLG